jgi:hypothetical protein
MDANISEGEGKLTIIYNDSYPELTDLDDIPGPSKKLRPDSGDLVRLMEKLESVKNQLKSSGK